MSGHKFAHLLVIGLLLVGLLFTWKRLYGITLVLLATSIAIVDNFL